jgi:hypothetical protein
MMLARYAHTSLSVHFKLLQASWWQSCKTFSFDVLAIFPSKFVPDLTFDGKTYAYP